MNGMPVIPKHHLETVCRIGQGVATCRFIVGTEHGICCAKHEQELALQINRRVAFDAFKARGDNCEGLKDDTAIDSI